MSQKPQYLTSKEAAEYLGYSEKTLRQSRVEGNLAAITAPPYYKMGHRVRYQKVDLDNWLAIWKPITNTCQYSVDPKLRVATRSCRHELGQSIEGGPKEKPNSHLL